jgi:GDP-4-dehydro-6-deoxy-D-mannose reductase
MVRTNNILITGGCGFVGQHLLEYYKKKSYQIYSISRNLPSSTLRCNFPEVIFLKCDLANIKQVEKALDTRTFSFVYHLAAQSIPSIAEIDASETFKSNVLATANLFWVLSKQHSKAKILFSSSNHVYGDTFKRENRVTEGAFPRPTSSYALSKLMAEKICLEYVVKGLLDIRIARSFNHFGPGQNQNLAFSNWISQILDCERDARQKKINVLETGELNVKRDFLYVSDVIKAYELILKKGKCGEIYNVCSSKEISLEKYMYCLLKASVIPASHFKIIQKNSRLRKNDFPVISGNNTKLKKLGWNQKYDTLQSIADLLKASRPH